MSKNCVVSECEPVDVVIMHYKGCDAVVMDMKFSSNKREADHLWEYWLATHADLFSGSQVIDHQSDKIRTVTYTVNFDSRKIELCIIGITDTCLSTLPAVKVPLGEQVTKIWKAKVREDIRVREEHEEQERVKVVKEELRQKIKADEALVVVKGDSKVIEEEAIKPIETEFVHLRPHTGPGNAFDVKVLRAKYDERVATEGDPYKRYFHGRGVCGKHTPSPGMPVIHYNHPEEIGWTLWANSMK